MKNKLNLYAPGLVVIASIFYVGQAVADTDKVVVVPMAGDSGLHGYETVDNVRAWASVSPGAVAASVVRCSTGKVVLGGGCFTDKPFTFIYLGGAKTSPTNESWACSFMNTDSSASTVNVTARVQCANAN